MKTCPVCHRESDDQARFCQECGTPLTDTVQEEVNDVDLTSDVVEQDVVDQNADVNTEVLEESAAEEVEDASALDAIQEEQAASDDEVPPYQEKEEVRWYYVEAGKTQGPFSLEQFEMIIQEGTVTPDTFIWKKGMPAWARLKETKLYVELGLAPAQEEVQEEIPAVTSVHEAVSELTGVVSATASQTTQQGEIPTVPTNSDSIPAVDQANKQEKPKDEEDQKWYYVYRNRTVGPFSEEVMIKKIHEGEIEGESYVWREGFRDWKHLRDTKFAEHLGGFNPYGGGTSFVDDMNRRNRSTLDDSPLYDEENYSNGPYDEVHPPYNSHPYYGNAGVRTRSIIMYLLLTILTCGLFEFYWLYATASDINRLCQKRGIKDVGDPMIVVVLTLVTCGIYSIYYLWKAGRTLYRLSGETSSDNSVLLAILGLFISPAALAILQDQINGLVEDGNYR